MEPYKQLHVHDGKFLLEVVSCSKHEAGDLNLTTNLGHASIRLIDNEGNVYSVGFDGSLQDENIDRNKNLLLVGKARVTSPDYQEFLPKGSFHEQIKTYEIGSEKDFIQLINFIEMKIAQTSDVESADSVYHSTQHNCSHFCKNIVDYAIENLEIVNGKKSFLSVLSKVCLSVKMFFIYIVVAILSFFKPALYNEDQKKFKKELDSRPMVFPANLY